MEIGAPYRWAREANPKARLIVNDYHVLADGCPAFFSLLQKALKEDIPFDGIGIQAHEPVHMRFPLDRVWQVLERYSALGKELHITEFTPTSGGKDIIGSHITGKWDEVAQAEYAIRFYTVCFAHPSVAAITWWDLVDSGPWAWLEGGGLFRRDFSPKPVYAALRKLIHEQWATQAEGVSDAGGKLSFRGFYGKYAVKVTRNGQVAQRFFHVGKGKRNIVDIVMPNSP
jgi:GH35 family endo-1,4-beta-xylanase